MGPSKTQQILAILLSRESELVARLNLSPDAHLSWKISREDIGRYIEKNGFPGSWVHRSLASFDGVYLLPCDSGWKVSFKERSRVWEEKLFQTEKEAIDYLIDEYYLMGKQLS